MEAKNVRQTFTEAKDQQASHSSYLLRQTAIAKKWLLILELKISLMSVEVKEKKNWASLILLEVKRKKVRDLSVI